MNYKDTLFMPKTDFEMKANLNKKEPDFQNRWIDQKLYQKILEKNKSKKLFFLHDGPPYANGNIHIGHALNKTLKDIIVRQKNLSGFLSPFIPGWDTHGLPIELAMLKQDKNAKANSIIEFRNKCKKYALEQIEIQKNQFKKIGLLTDFEKTYYTLNHDFEIQQLKLFLEMVKQNLIIRDLKPVFWSWSSQSALAEAEIEYKDIESDSIYIAFKAIKNNIIPENTYYIIWTTTPWTIPCNLAIAVKPNAKYVLFQWNEKKYVVAKDLLENFAKKINIDLNSIQIQYEFIGNQLDNFQYIHPLTNEILPIINADYVSLDDGTGLVHNAPGLGSDDYLACKKYNINPYAPLDDYGKFTKDVKISELNGLFYLDANQYVIDQLKLKDQLLLCEKIQHSEACDWRTKKPIIRRATNQWFVNLKPIQKDIVNTLNNDVKSINPKAIDRMIDMISKRVEWCISRQRTWGVPIPMIFDENSQPIYDVNLIEHIIDILDKNGVDVWFEWPVDKFLTDKYLNNQKKYYKEKDIMDVWFDSGSSHMMFKKWGYEYPADMYLEGSDQYRGWFNSSLITGVIYNKKAPYKELLQHGFTLDQNGLKMSKSIGNVVNPLDIFNKFGADIFRLFVASCEYYDDQRFGDVVLNQICEIYRRIRNTLFKYSLSILNGFNLNDIQDQFEIEDEYILFKLHNLLIYIDAQYKKYNFSSIVKSINEFTLELSSWYFDLIKDPMYCDSLDSVRRKQIQTVIYYILKNILICLAPIIPHTAEEVYDYLPFKDFESIHLENWIKLTPFTKFNNVNDFNDFFSLKNQIYKQIEELRNSKMIKKSNEIDVYLKTNPTKFNLEQLKKWLNVSRVDIDSSLNMDIVLKPTSNIKCERCWNYYSLADMHNEEICNRCNSVITKK